jgi:hypothetical protein
MQVPFYTLAKTKTGGVLMRMLPYHAMERFVGTIARTCLDASASTVLHGRPLAVWHAVSIKTGVDSYVAVDARCVVSESTDRRSTRVIESSCAASLEWLPSDPVPSAAQALVLALDRGVATGTSLLELVGTGRPVIHADHVVTSSPHRPVAPTAATRKRSRSPDVTGGDSPMSKKAARPRTRE